MVTICFQYLTFHLMIQLNLIHFGVYSLRLISLNSILSSFYLMIQEIITNYSSCFVHRSHITKHIPETNKPHKTKRNLTGWSEEVEETPM